MGRGGPERVAYMKRENEPVLLESCNFFSWREPTTCIMLAYVVEIPINFLVVQDLELGIW